MRLHLSSWPEVEAYLKGSRGIVVPVGSTEQHGPSGLIGTDVICPEVIALKAAEEAGFLVAPSFNVGIAPHHMGFPGTISLRPETMIAAMGDWVSSLATHGFERIYFFNGHGGNIGTIKTALAGFAGDPVLSAVSGNRGPVKVKCANWWDFAPVMDFCRATYGAGHGSHATPSEIAVTQFAYPEAIKAVAGIAPKIAANGRYTDAADFRAKFPDGRMGSDPTLAAPEDGEVLIGLSAKGLVADYSHFVES